MSEITVSVCRKGLFNDSYDDLTCLNSHNSRSSTDASLLSVLFYFTKKLIEH